MAKFIDMCCCKPTLQIWTQIQNLMWLQTCGPMNAAFCEGVCSLYTLRHWHFVFLG